MIKKTVLLLALLPALSVSSMELIKEADQNPLHSVLISRADLYTNSHYLSQNEVLLELAYHGKLFYQDTELIDASDQHFLKQLLEQSIQGAIYFQNDLKGRHHINNIRWITKMFLKTGVEIQTLQECMSWVAQSPHPGLKEFFKDILKNIHTNCKAVFQPHSPKSSPKKKDLIIPKGKLVHDKRSDEQKIKETEDILAYHYSSGRKANIRTRISRISNSIQLPDRSTTTFAFLALALYAAYYLDARLFEFLLLTCIANCPWILNLSATQNNEPNQEILIAIDVPAIVVQQNVHVEDINQMIPLIPALKDNLNDNDDNPVLQPLNVAQNAVGGDVVRPEGQVDPIAIPFIVPDQNLDREIVDLNAQKDELVNDIQKIEIKEIKIVVPVENSFENEKSGDITDSQFKTSTTLKSCLTSTSVIGGLLTATLTVIALKKYHEWSLKQKDQKTRQEDSQKEDSEKIVQPA
ncbi:hypothetical protein H0X06_00975 [Candidatus Dependentiae bacterium]|nr:hypothetical protein [Candidatus Dependentiae bacterium]